MDLLIPYLLVGLGGAIGSVLRFAISLGSAALVGDSFPWGTVLINVAGSFVIGYCATLPASPAVRSFVMVGMCGGFTTFSSFSLQTLTLMRGGAWLGAVANILLSVVLCLVAVSAGYALGGSAARQ